MERKDIEEFLRRSNSICDQDTTFPEKNVAVRRMSLKEFTGLDPSNKEQIADLSLPAWKASLTATSLINSYSARRRSVLSTEALDSPCKRLAVPKEETLDIKIAIQRISALRHRIASFCRDQHQVDTRNGQNERHILMEESKRTASVAAELASLPAKPEDPKWLNLVAEITDSVDCLCTKALAVMAQSSVYHCQLITTELEQVLTTLGQMLDDVISGVSDHCKSSTHLISTTNQLSRAISSLT